MRGNQEGKGKGARTGREPGQERWQESRVWKSSSVGPKWGSCSSWRGQLATGWEEAQALGCRGCLGPGSLRITVLWEEH